MIEIPQVADGQEALEEFARSFDGYEHWGKHVIPRLLEWDKRFARSGEPPEGPADLRAALFMPWRAYDRGDQPFEDFQIALLCVQLGDGYVQLGDEFVLKDQFLQLLEICPGLEGVLQAFEAFQGAIR